MAGGPTRQDTHRIHVKIADPAKPEAMIDYGVWDKFSGGEVDSDETKYNPGGMAPPVSLGGRRTVGNVTISRLYRLYRDHSHLNTLLASAGKSKAVIQRQPLDIQGNVFGNPLVYNGTLKRVAPPDLDSEQSGAALLELEFTVDGFPHVQDA
jgi:hypothetical protein